MHREVLATLNRWRLAEVHLPLLVRGARQIGKTYLIEAFGKEYFSNMVSINFELEPEYAQCFNSYDPQAICSQVGILKRQKIIPGETLLFLDEIQECPKAITALRYFKEKMPELHVVGAGSLLEFALREKDFQMPVGRVQFFYMRPLSFREYLRAVGELPLLEFIDQVHCQTQIPNPIHQRLLSLVREYMIVGGMPAAIQSYLANKDWVACQEMQTVLLSTYRNDFGKYASLSQHKYLQTMFTRAPALIGEQIKYVRVDPDMRSRDLKRAMDDLALAGVLTKIISTKGSGFPLNAVADENRFKLLFLDLGLARRANYFDVRLLLEQDLAKSEILDAGAMAEQLVGQELLAYQSPFEETQLYYWSREAKSSQAEVDYVISIKNHIVPIEVKAGSTGRIKSLHLFMAEKSCPWGIKICSNPLSIEKNILSLPFYLISEIPRLVEELYHIADDRFQGQKDEA